MAVGRTEYGDIKPRTAGWMSKTMLTVGKPLLITDRFATQHFTFPKNEGETVTFRRYEKFPLANVPLAEGVTPDPTKMTKEDIPATLMQYGAWVELTDKIKDLHEDPVQQQASMRSGEQMAETIEDIRWDTLVAGTNVIYTNGAARAAVNTVLARGDIRLATRTLKRQLARMINRVIASTPNYNTFGVEAGYWAATHVDMEVDIRASNGFINAKDYGPTNKAVDGEIGAIDGVRFVLTTTIPSWSGGGAVGGANVLETGAVADVYPIVVFARDAYAVIPLAGYSAVKIMVLNPNTPRGGDPLGQRGSLGWKTWQTICILKEEWMLRIESACTDVPGD